MTPATSPTPPIDWPTVVVDGPPLEVKFSFLVTYRASRAGIDIRNLGNYASTIATHLDLFAIVVAPLFEAKGEVAPNGEQWAARIAVLPNHDQVMSSVAQAILKAITLYRSSKTPPAAAPPTPQTTAMGNDPK